MAEYLVSQNFDVWLDVWNINAESSYRQKIEEADVILIFFSKTYKRDRANRMRHLQYAADRNKALLLVKLQADIDFSENAAIVDYLDENDIGSVGCEIIRQIGLLLNKVFPTLPPPAAYHNRFELTTVPYFASDFYQPRVGIEVKLFRQLIHFSNNPDNSIFIIHGESGVGKTMLMSRILHCDPEAIAGVSLKKPTIVFWLSCSGFSDEKFDDDDKTTFQMSLLEVARLNDPSFPKSSVSTQQIIPHFMSKNKRILFVLDDVPRLELLLHMFNMVGDNGDNFPCCVVISQLPFDILSASMNRLNLSIRRQAVSPFSKTEMESLLNDLFLEAIRPTPKQLSELVKWCCGLPKIAELVKGRFTISKSNSLDQFLAEENLVLLGNNNTQIGKKTVANYLQTVVERLSDDQRHCFYAFLMFDLGSVAVKDLHPFWQIANNDLLEENFVRASFVCRTETSTDSDQQLFVHRMLYDAALLQATSEFSLSGTNREDQLRDIRMKLVKGEIAASTEMVMFEAVRQQRLTLCQRLVTLFDGQSLAVLAASKSTQSEEKGRSFVHFLYHAIWPGRDTEYPEDGNVMSIYGINNSYRLIRAILVKLKKTVSADEMFSVISVKADDGKSFLADLFSDEDKVSQQLDRCQLILLVSIWRKDSKM